jgi:hypothetical protein
MKAGCGDPAAGLSPGYGAARLIERIALAAAVVLAAVSVNALRHDGLKSIDISRSKTACTLHMK